MKRSIITVPQLYCYFLFIHYIELKDNDRKSILCDCSTKILLVFLLVQSIMQSSLVCLFIHHFETLTRYNVYHVRTLGKKWFETKTFSVRIQATDKTFYYFFPDEWMYILLKIISHKKEIW